MKTLTFEIKEDKYDEVTVEEAEEVQKFVNHMNWLADEGYITMEVDDDGQVRFYPTDDPESQKLLQKMQEDYGYNDKTL